MKTLDKAYILAFLWVDYKEDMQNDPTWSEYLQYFDISLPLAYMYAFDVVDQDNISDLGATYIEEAWESLCSMLLIESEAEYSDLGACFDASPNGPLYGQILVKEVE